MNTKTALFVIATVLIAVSSWGQQSPSPAVQPQPVQKPAPCVAVSPLPKRVKIKVPVWLQKQIDKQQAKLGTTVDVNGMIADATAPKPCPVTPIPATAPPPAPTPAAPPPMKNETKQ
jgi:hypothetical protein